ncbi:MAG TPA: hypothetical protein VIS31_02345 [Woeseiaceae bacterium]
MKRRPLELGAAAWGFAEATVFFIVPDVLLSVAAVGRYRFALLACLWATAGALLGGLALWVLADADYWRALFAALPAMDENMIANAHARLAADGSSALFFGVLTGTPYKIFVIEARELGFPLLPFLLVSIPARLVRFAFVTSLAALFGHLTRRRIPGHQQRLIVIGFWVAFYAWFFSVMP